MTNENGKSLIFNSIIWKIKLQGFLCWLNRLFLHCVYIWDVQLLIFHIVKKKKQFDFQSSGLISGFITYINSESCREAWAYFWKSKLFYEKKSFTLSFSPICFHSAWFLCLTGHQLETMKWEPRGWGGCFLLCILIAASCPPLLPGGSAINDELRFLSKRSQPV